MELSKIDIENVNKNEWAKFVFNHSNGNIFQTPEMYEVYKNTKNFDPLFVAVVDDKRDIVGILVSVIQREFSGPFGGLTSRCVTWGSPLIKDDLREKEKIEVLNLILKEQNRIAKKKAIYMQFRNIWDTSDFKPFFEQNGYEYEDHLNIRIDLTKTEEELMRNMKKDKRRAIKKAIANKMEFIEIDNKDKIKYFYEMLKETYKDAKVPLSNISFFDIIYDHLVLKGMANYYLAELNGKFIGGRLELYYKDMVYDWYAGDINEYVTYYPNEFLLWNILIHGQKNGYKSFNFMGAGKPNVEYGVRDWKIRFGGILINYGRYHNVLKKTKMKIAKMGLKIIKKMK